jgi:hypothetical protein
MQNKKKSTTHFLKGISLIFETLWMHLASKFQKEVIGPKKFVFFLQLGVPQNRLFDVNFKVVDKVSKKSTRKTPG